MNACPPSEFRISLEPCPHGGDHGFLVLGCQHDFITIPVQTREEAIRFYRRFVAQGMPANLQFEPAVAAAPFLSGEMPGEEEEVEAKLPSRPRHVMRAAAFAGRSLLTLLRLGRRWRNGSKTEDEEVFH